MSEDLQQASKFEKPVLIEPKEFQEKVEVHAVSATDDVLGDAQARDDEEASTIVPETVTTEGAFGIPNQNFVVPTSNFIDAVKLLGEWNKWLVTVELAVIGAIGFILKSEERIALHEGWIGLFAMGMAITSVLTLGTSIIQASRLILSLPFFVEGCQARGGKPVILMVHRTIREGRTSGPKVVEFLKNQNKLFTCGIMAFSLFVISLLILPPHPKNDSSQISTPNSSK